MDIFKGGHDRWVLLKKLPDLIPDLLSGNTGKTIQTLWKVRNKIIKILLYCQPLFTQKLFCPGF